MFIFKERSTHGPQRTPAMVVKIDKSHAAQEGHENIINGLQRPAGQRATTSFFQAVGSSHRVDGVTRQPAESLIPAFSAKGEEPYG